MSSYKYIDDPTRCAKCGVSGPLTKHHWKQPGRVQQNTPQIYRVEGIIIMLCRKCHDRVHGMGKKTGGKPRGGWVK